ncbi:imelysin family protein [Balneola sp. MJW-20]|uniref:imelysin family protein n=1 Tax=Gracilimonas aurantiaca TaxID=3234185 RepID=UPI0034651533
MRKLSFLFITILFLGVSCGDNTPSGPSPDDFDRQAILINWSDNIIIPAFRNMSTESAGLRSETESFVQSPTVQNLTSLREAWETAYLAFQHVSMFEMGVAMDLRYRDNLNIYPTNPDEIEESINSGSWNFDLPSLNDSQGFPALDYLINGLAATDAEIVEFYTTNPAAEQYRSYLLDLTLRIETLTNTVLEDWTSGYRDEFVNNSGNGANASLDMMVNDYIYYYERNLRAGKIGIPAGVFSGNPLSTHVEAYYSDGFSKALFMESLTAVRNFFNGDHFDSQNSGESLSSYLQYLQSMKESVDLSTLIDEQFVSAENAAAALSPDFRQQVEDDNTLMLATYDQLQANVVLLKVDMLQSLNINVDYVDADGD